jgi:hypothetical protein
MTDIVDRLRDRSYSHKIRDPLVEEAADEIERLRNGAVQSRETVPVTEPMQKEKRAEVSQQEPVAWAADIPGKFGAAPTMLFGYTQKLVKGIAAAGGDVVEPFPLYRNQQPTLTDAEREAVTFFVVLSHSKDGRIARHAATLRALLERLK